MEDDEKLLKLDGYDEAIIGVAAVWDTSGQQVERVIYSGDLLVMALIREGCGSVEEATEHVEHHIEGAYVGPSTPIVMWETPDGIFEEEEQQ